MQNFEVHSNESACRKSGRLGMEQARSKVSLLFKVFANPQFEISHCGEVSLHHQVHYHFPFIFEPKNHKLVWFL